MKLKLFLIFIVTFVIYNLNTYQNFLTDTKEKTYRNLITSADVVPNTFLPYLIVKYQTFQFDKIKNTLKEFQSIKNKLPYFLIKTGEHYYSVYPTLTGILAVPFYIVPVGLQFIPALNLWDYVLKVLVLGRISASFYTTLSVVLVYLIVSKISKNTSINLILTALYAFGTTTFSVSSRSLWQHTSSEFIFALVLLLLLKVKENRKIIPLVGFLTSLLVLARITNVFYAVAIAVYIFSIGKKDVWKFLLPAIPAVIFLLISNYYSFGGIFADGYSARSDIKWSTPLLTGVVGFLFSPSRSFLFITPPLLLSYIAMFQVFKNSKFGGENNYLYRFMTIPFILTLLLFSKWYDWSGANGFGYRMITDFLPFLILLTGEASKNFGKIAKGVLIVFVVYSIFIQTNAVYTLRSRCSEKDNWNFRCLTPRIGS